MREGVTTLEVDWASVEVLDLTVHPLNLLLYKVHTSKDVRVLIEYPHD